MLVKGQGIRAAGDWRHRAGLESGVGAAYDDMSTFEAAMIADVGRMAEGLA